MRVTKQLTIANFLNYLTADFHKKSSQNPFLESINFLMLDRPFLIGGKLIIWIFRIAMQARAPYLQDVAVQKIAKNFRFAL